MSKRKSSKIRLSSCFYWFRGGQFISSLGSMSGYIAMSWWILEKTGSAASLGVILAVPMFLDTLMNPLLAPIVDKFSRKKLSVIGDAWSGVIWIVMGLYAASGHFSTTVVCILYVINTIGSSLSSVAGSVLPRMLVAGDEYELAMRQTVVIGNVSKMVGGVIGGTLAQMCGSVMAFGINGFTFFIAAACSLFIKQNTTPEKEEGGVKYSSFIHEWFGSLKEGIHLSLKNRYLVTIVIMCAGVQFFTACYTLCVPLLVKNGHGLPESYFGLLKTCSAIGVIISTLLFAKISKKSGYVGTTIIGSIMVTVAFILLPFTSVLFLPFLMMFLYGFGEVLSDLPIGTRLGTSVPMKYQARVFSIIGLLSGISASLGASCFGFLVEKFGLKLVMVGSGIAVGLLIAIILLEGSLVKILNGCSIFDDDENAKKNDVKLAQ